MLTFLIIFTTVCFILVRLILKYQPDAANYYEEEEEDDDDLSNAPGHEIYNDPVFSDEELEYYIYEQQQKEDE